MTGKEYVRIRRAGRKAALAALKHEMSLPLYRILREERIVNNRGPYKGAGIIAMPSPHVKRRLFDKYPITGRF